MTNWTMMQKSDNDFMGSFSAEVKKYLGINNNFPSEYPARWLLDSFQLLNTDWPNIYGDYSFIVVPASKALENWIFKIANDLGIDVETDQAGVIRSRIESNLEIILTKVEKKLGKSIKIDITHLRNFIQEYRNDIVHYHKKIENVAMAKNKIIAIYEKINTITNKLIDADLIKVDVDK